MWLINASKLVLEEYFDSEVPGYAILSHVWGFEEISFSEMRQNHEGYRLRAGFKKIVNCCTAVRNFGIDYAWIDTCCIDKRSSADLSEAINSMYRYYTDAAMCLVYLADVPGRQETDGDAINRAEQLEEMKSSRWFRRGWTLQELIAPSQRYFFAKDWSLIPLVEDGQDLVQLISEVTNISSDLLTHKKSLSSYCIAERMSWASARQTTRSEDIAYSLMGIFDVNIPILYGEGGRKAFRRLQKEIIHNSFDQTIFAWRGNYDSSGLIANAPSEFADTPPLGLWSPNSLEPYSITNIGLSIAIEVLPETPDETMQRGGDPQGQYFWALLQCDIKTTQEWRILMIRLKLVEGVQAYVNGMSCKAYRRVSCAEWSTINGTAYTWAYEHALVLEDEHYQLIIHSEAEHGLRWREIVASYPEDQSAQSHVSVRPMSPSKSRRSKAQRVLYNLLCHATI